MTASQFYVLTGIATLIVGLLTTLIGMGVKITVGWTRMKDQMAGLSQDFSDLKSEVHTKFAVFEERLFNAIQNRTGRR